MESFEPASRARTLYTPLSSLEINLFLNVFVTMLLASNLQYCFIIIHTYATSCW